ncbi:MAG: YggT family protein [Gammaproteobacteria bacterium]|nr:YggT family protein [Gammaproteobacteria bacterium]
MGGPFGQAAVFLIDTLFWLYILAVLLRFLFQLVRADFYNPFSQALVAITNPTLLPLRRMIPGLYGIDFAALVLVLVLQVVKNVLLGLIVGQWYNLLGLIVYSAAELLQMTVYLFIFLIFIRVLLSWVAPYGGHNPVTGLLFSVTEPLMRPARRLIPPLSGLDLSPVAVFILLYLTLILIVTPLLSVSKSLLV